MDNNDINTYDNNINMDDNDIGLLRNRIGDMCDALVDVDSELRTADYLAKKEIEEYIRNTCASIKEIDESFFNRLKESVIDRQSE